MVIIGFPGVGKTSFLKENLDKAYDLDSGFLKYKGPCEYVFDTTSPNLEEVNIEKIEKKILEAYEIFKDKNNQSKDFWKLNENWKNLYPKIIEKFENNGNKPYVLVPLLEKECLEYLKNRNIDILYVYPSIECMEDFMNRYANRQDGRQIEMFANLDKFTKQIYFLNKTIPKESKIVLKPGEFLSNAIERIEKNDFK